MSAPLFEESGVPWPPGAAIPLEPLSLVLVTGPGSIHLPSFQSLKGNGEPHLMTVFILNYFFGGREKIRFCTF